MGVIGGVTFPLLFIYLFIFTASGVQLSIGHKLTLGCSYGIFGGLESTTSSSGVFLLYIELSYMLHLLILVRS